MKVTYKKYLKSPKWQTVRYRFLRSKLIKRNILGFPLCDFCNKDNQKFHVHHIRYNNIGNENLNDLKLLCESCHSYLHKRQKQLNISVYKATLLAGKELAKLFKTNDKITKIDKVKEVDTIKLDKEALVGINFDTEVRLVKHG